MNRFLKSITGFLAGALLCAGASAAPAALADDAVTLKDGRVLRGEITKEVEGAIWITVQIAGISQEEFIPASDILKIERDAADPVPTRRAAPTPPPRSSGGVPRAAVLTLGGGGDKDFVGGYMTAKAIRDCIPHLEQEKIDVVVLLVNSGGGALLEIPRLSDVIEYELKSKFRVVAWIRWAISAAAMTAHAVEEIYFMPEAAYGACTGWSGDLQAMKGREFLEVVFDFERISARGGHHPFIMKAMQGNANAQEESFPLSCDINPVTGEVSWYQNDQGQHLVNPPGKVLTFDSEQAAKYKFSKGTAATIEELTRLMGYQELEWVGKRKQGFIYPICRAEETMMAYRDKVYQDERSTNEYFINYQTYIQLAQGTQDRNNRGWLVGQARNVLNSIKSMVKNNPNFALFVFGIPTEAEWKYWVQDQERLLADLMRR